MPVFRKLKLQDLFAKFGHKIAFLSAYSPDLNPIEITIIPKVCLKI